LKSGPFVAVLDAETCLERGTLLRTSFHHKNLLSSTFFLRSHPQLCIEPSSNNQLLHHPTVTINRATDGPICIVTFSVDKDPACRLLKLCSPPTPPANHPTSQNTFFAGHGILATQKLRLSLLQLNTDTFVHHGSHCKSYPVAPEAAKHSFTWRPR